MVANGCTDPQPASPSMTAPLMWRTHCSGQNWWPSGGRPWKPEESRNNVTAHQMYTPPRPHRRWKNIGFHFLYMMHSETKKKRRKSQLCRIYAQRRHDLLKKNIYILWLVMQSKAWKSSILKSLSFQCRLRHQEWKKCAEESPDGRLQAAAWGASVGSLAAGQRRCACWWWPAGWCWLKWSLAFPRLFYIWFALAALCSGEKKGQVNICKDRAGTAITFTLAFKVFRLCARFFFTFIIKDRYQEKAVG